MKFLFDSADRYIARCSWKDLALIKFCLFAMGLLVGVQLPKKYRTPALAAGAAVFLVTYVPLMAKYLRVVLDRDV